MLTIRTNASSTVLCVLSLWGTATWADTQSAHIDHAGFQISGYAGVAGTTIHPGTLQGFNETDSLHPNKNHQQEDFTWGFGAAYRFMPPAVTRNLLHDISLGLDFMYFQTNQKGYTWLYEQPAYNNYTYQLPIDSLRLLVDSEWSFHSLLRPYLFPFIEGGIGFARNTASYNDSPLIANTEGLSINSNAQYQFSYTVGGGVKILLPFNTELSVRYLYADLGNATTSSNASVPLAAPITIPLSTQTWLAGLTYLF